MSDLGSDDYLSEWENAESEWSPQKQKVSSHKRNLNTQSPRSDCPSPAKKRQLSNILNSGKCNYPGEGSETDTGGLTASLAEIIGLCNTVKSHNICEQMLRQIIRTAYQFTRHGHRQKLTVKDLDKAFKIHSIDMKAEDMNETDSIGIGDESQPTCSGMWLREP